ncbi:MAG: hypothetical protein RID53_10420 [Coleofasciculus sp. B1-GNL1-01]|uniref:hypothetical protein n=1 Tax=Coleofasciculus sp. B1-GNL1-01 TaxID=3068484 RepID=UPI0032F5844E
MQFPQRQNLCQKIRFNGSGDSDLGGKALDIVMLYFRTAEALPWMDKLPNQSSNAS